ncbi:MULTISPECIES: helix-turn-helix domain-containing protein [Olivibacter]|uniref:Helix-turn-helix domain-containing protein n=1 Tax=Olivibacter oleidegradans TaxID=760123 RepID=A0ABV6HIF6_9SPHI|nr:hypothetical protein [Olivibacter jilunii]
MLDKIDLDILALTIGKNISAYRTFRKEAIEVTARELNLDIETLQEIEKGAFSGLNLNLIVDIANYFNVTLQQLLNLQIVQVFNHSQNVLPGERKVILKNEQRDGYTFYINDLKEVIFQKEEKIKELELKLSEYK